MDAQNKNCETEVRDKLISDFFFSRCAQLRESDSFHQSSPDDTIKLVWRNAHVMPG